MDDNQQLVLFIYTDIYAKKVKQGVKNTEDCRAYKGTTGSDWKTSD